MTEPQFVYDVTAQKPHNEPLHIGIFDSYVKAMNTVEVVVNWTYLGPDTELWIGKSGDTGWLIQGHILNVISPANYAEAIRDD